MGRKPKAKKIESQSKTQKPKDNLIQIHESFTKVEDLIATNNDIDPIVVKKLTFEDKLKDFEKEKKRQWKDKHQNNTIKQFKKLKHFKRIDSMPWFTSEKILKGRDNDISFGIAFPRFPAKGDIFLRIDTNPSKLFKFNEKEWINVDKEQNTSYTFNEQYLQYLISQINQGLYNTDLLTEVELEQLEQYIKING